MDYQPSHIGLVAAGKRDILPGNEYDHLIERSDGGKTLVDPNGNIADTMVQIGRVLGKYYKDTEGLAPVLKGSSKLETCRNIWDFIFNHIQYELDQPGEEQLRRPARAWADRRTGVDCDCYSIFAGSILMNLGVPFKLRITKYDGRAYYQHVYVVVPNGSSEIIIDPVLNQFNYEKQFSGHKDYTMEGLGIPIHVLHGVDDAPARVSVIDNLLNGSGIGSAESKEQAIFNHLIETRNNIVENPGLIDSVEYSQGFLEMLNYAIDNFWKGPKARAKAFKVLAANEAAINKRNGVTLDDLDGVNDPDDEYIEGFAGFDVSEAVDDDDLYQFNGIGDLAGKEEREARKKARKEKKAEKKAEKAQKKADKKAERKEEKSERKQERREAKGFFRKIGVALEQGGEKFIKYNPITIAARNGFLVALRLNAVKMSSRLKWGYATAEQAKAGGISDKKHQAAKRALAKIEKLFDDKLQGSKVSLKNAILSGKHNISGFDDDYVENISGLGELVTAAAMTAAAPVIIKVIDTIGDEMGPVEKEEGAADIFADSGMDKNATQEKKESWIKTLLKNIFGKKEAADAMKDVEMEDKSLPDGGGNTADDPPVDKPLLTKIGDFVQANPILTAGICAGAAYAFIPSVREGVNNMFSGSKSKKQVSSGTAGLGKLPAKKSRKKSKKVSSINLK
ncbi:hypothetical protein SDC9_73090 [bioreactor metagenome]|uniref:Transglutaminase-like domain-containing protein n=1 Tax=bioreactor metagenome TaxID=1076179 RepID=A0A644YDF9_9ZZZZ